MNAPHSHAPPLAVWAWVAGLTALTAGAIAGLAYQHGTSQTRFEAFNRERLQAFVAAPAAQSDDFRVIALGTSLLRHGTEPDAVLERLAGRALGGRRVRHLRITRSMGLLDDFQALWAPIAELKPSLLVIQADLLTRERLAPRHDDDERQQVVFAVLRGHAGSLAAREQDQPPDQTGAGQFARARDLGFQQRLLEDSGFQLPPPSSVLRRLQAVVADGTRVLVVDVPRNAALESHLAAEKGAWLERLGSDAAWRGRLRVARHPGRLDPSLFSDGTHLNQLGRPLFTSWYVARLAAPFEEPPAP